LLFEFFELPLALLEFAVEAELLELVSPAAPVLDVDDGFEPALLPVSGVAVPEVLGLVLFGLETDPGWLDWLPLVPL
jgi:hypothetical protein